MNARTLAVLAGWLVLAAAVPGARAGEEPITPQAQAALAEALAPSLVRVEYALTFDKGEEPEGAGWAKRCPNCGGYHGGGVGHLLREERPLEIAGWLLSPSQVIIPDPLIHPRFVKSIAVRAGKELVEARVAAYAAEHKALILDLQQPLTGAKPLAFDAGKPGPCLTVTVSNENADLTTTIQPLNAVLSVTETGRRFVAVPSDCLIVDRAGAPVGLCLKDELPPDDSWKGSPLKWKAVSAADMDQALAALEKRAAAELPRVTLNFRSPKKEAGGRFARFNRGEDDESSTERNVVGVLVSDRCILVLAETKPAITARLDKITVHPAEGPAVPAKFAGSLADYGAFLVETASPLAGAARLSGEDIRGCRNAMLLSAQITQQGEKRIAHFLRCRIPAFELGWKRQVYPSLPGREHQVFLFDFKGGLAALPISRRSPVSLGDRDWSWGRYEGKLTPAAYLKAVLADPAKALDASNVPLTPEEESRLAWVGLLLQPLNKELARANNVSEVTKDGESGALVSFVYPDSPAAKAGLKVGAVLLRLHLQGQLNPVEIKLNEYGNPFGGEPFPWDQLDHVPDRAYDQIPKPWPAAEDPLTRALTDLGFGKKYTIEYFADGKVRTADLEVTPSPPHYDSAPRYKSDALGLTVRDLTFEVRRYFQMKPEDPGVIVSNLKPGSKGSVAGIKPYEIIMQVNGVALHSVKDFEKLSDKQEELRLAVKRMTKERQVKIRLPGADAKPPEGEQKPPEAEKKPPEQPDEE